MAGFSNTEANQEAKQEKGMDIESKNEVNISPVETGTEQEGTSKSTLDRKSILDNVESGGGAEVRESKDKNNDENSKVMGNHDRRPRKDNPRAARNGKATHSTGGSFDVRREREHRFREELEKLQEGLRRVSSRVHTPERRPCQPYVFNALKPYYNMSGVRFLAAPPSEVRGHRSRRTALNLIDPWTDHRMDNDLQTGTDVAVGDRRMDNDLQTGTDVAVGDHRMDNDLQTGTDVAVGDRRMDNDLQTGTDVAVGDRHMDNDLQTGTDVAVGDRHMDNDLQTGTDVAVGDRRRTKHKAARHKEKQSGVPRDFHKLEGTAFKFPVVKLERLKLSSTQLNYGDLPTLRQELGILTSRSAKPQFLADYQVTRADFYRRNLHKLAGMHPENRAHVCSSYLAYLQNNPGSKRAVVDCIHSLKFAH